MSSRRDLTHSEPLQRLKLANRRTVQALKGTALAAEVAGSYQQRVSDCTLPNTPDFFRQDEVHALEEATRGAADWPAITRAHARNLGFALLPLPQSAPGNSDWHQSLGDVSREAGDAVAKICAALADGRVVAAEIREGHIIEEIDEAIGALAKLRGLAEAVLETGSNVRTLRSDTR